MTKTYEKHERAIVFRPEKGLCDPFFVYMEPDGFFDKMSVEWNIFLCDGEIPEPAECGFSLLECDIERHHWSSADDYDDADTYYHTEYLPVPDDMWEKIKKQVNPLD